MPRGERPGQLDVDALTRDGYVHLARVVPRELVDRARAAIDRDLALHYSPRMQGLYDHRSYCPRLRGRAAITNLVTRSRVRDILGALLGPDAQPDRGQIALRWAHNAKARRLAEPHIDGFASGKNGLARGKVHNFNALVGVFLTRTAARYAGNFSVWPGSHEAYAEHFRRRRSAALKEPMPRPALGHARQLETEVGDVVVCNYLLGHTATVNLSDDDRVAVFFRYALPDARQRQLAYLTRPWAGWNLTREEPALSASSSPERLRERSPASPLPAPSP